jgi:hypothetical protein
MLGLCGTSTLGVNDSQCFTLDTDELVQRDRLSAFPNPSSDQLFLSSNNVPTIINFPYTILDRVGSVVMSKDDSSSLESIDTHFLQSGIYFINIINGATRGVLKFVKR